jgi:5-(carboxyamino)imidazole ribonucleotide mutase
MSVRVAIVIGSKTDLETIAPARDVFDEFGIGHEVKVLSAHRTPDALAAYIQAAEAKGVEVFIAAAGGAAHLPGVVASRTTLPVLGVPVASTSLLGLDSLLAIVQMPKGIPVATFAIGKPGAGNAALFAIALMAGAHPELRAKLTAWRKAQADKLLADQP